MGDRQTFMINFIAGPGSGKSTISALVFAKLKLRGFVVEYVQEFAKTLVWTKNFETLNNQYYVSNKQYTLFKQMDRIVDFIVTDAPLANSLYYNRHFVDNTSNIEKTEKFILNCISEFNNVNIFLERGEFAYEQQGRMQNEEEAKEIDVILKHLLRHNNIPYISFSSDPASIDAIIDFIIERVNKNQTQEPQIEDASQ